MSKRPPYAYVPTRSTYGLRLQGPPPVSLSGRVEPTYGGYGGYAAQQLPPLLFALPAQASLANAVAFPARLPSGEPALDGFDSEDDLLYEPSSRLKTLGPAATPPAPLIGIPGASRLYLEPVTCPAPSATAQTVLELLFPASVSELPPLPFAAPASKPPAKRRKLTPAEKEAKERDAAAAKAARTAAKAAKEVARLKDLDQKRIAKAAKELVKDQAVVKRTCWSNDEMVALVELYGQAQQHLEVKYASSQFNGSYTSKDRAQYIKEYLDSLGFGKQ